jgi:ATP-dependent Clp protease ATP-binding subunit ClpC
VEHGYDREFGARPLRRLIQSSVEDKLSDAVLGGRFKTDEAILVDDENDEIVLKLDDSVLNDDETEDHVEEPLPTG